MSALKDRPHDYVPQPGTIATKAIVALAAVDNCRLSSAALLEACGQPASYPGLNGVMNLSMHHGLVERKREGHITFWELTKKGFEVANYIAAQGAESASVAAEKPEAEPVPGNEVQKDEIPAFVKMPQPTCTGVMHNDVVFGFAKPGSTALDEIAPLRGAAISDGDNFECALTSAGRLVIHADGRQFALTAEQTAALFAHTDKARGIEWAEGA